MTTVPQQPPSRTEHAIVGTVQDLIALGLLAMQAHWHPGRPSFRPVHELLDDIADRALEAADNLAERAAALALRDRAAITTFEGILEILAAELHQTLDELSDEPFMHELLAGIAIEVDKHTATLVDGR